MTNDSISVRHAILLLLSFWIGLILVATAAVRPSGSFSGTDLWILALGPLLLPVGLGGLYRSLGFGHVPDRIFDVLPAIIGAFWVVQLVLHVRFVRFRGWASFAAIAVLSSASCWGCVTSVNGMGSPFK